LNSNAVVIIEMQDGKNWSKVNAEGHPREYGCMGLVSQSALDPRTSLYTLPTGARRGSIILLCGSPASLPTQWFLWVDVDVGFAATRFFEHSCWLFAWLRQHSARMAGSTLLPGNAP
jgi:hypothetical protein